MTITPIRPAVPSVREEVSTPESDRVAVLQEMIRSGRYAGYLDELRGELEKAKAARSEIRQLTAVSVLAA